jgi:hypothetical protein
MLNNLTWGITLPFANLLALPFLIMSIASMPRRVRHPVATDRARADSPPPPRSTAVPLRQADYANSASPPVNVVSRLFFPLSTARTDLQNSS